MREKQRERVKDIEREQNISNTLNVIITQFDFMLNAYNVTHIHFKNFLLPLLLFRITFKLLVLYGRTIKIKKKKIIVITVYWKRAKNI